jgi:hypothetical protein
VKPTGYNMARFAARASPSVMTRERLLRATLSSLYPKLLKVTLFGPKLTQRCTTALSSPR